MSWNKGSPLWAGGNPPELKQVVAAGDTADTDIPVAGVVATSIIVGCVGFPDAGGAAVDNTADTSVTSSGNIQVTTDTTGQSLLVTYWDLT